MGFLEGEVDDLDQTTHWAIWHQTDAAIDWCVDDSEPPENWSSEELGRFILKHYVLPAAEEYSNVRIRAGTLNVGNEGTERENSHYKISA